MTYCSECKHLWPSSCVCYQGGDKEIKPAPKGSCEHSWGDNCTSCSECDVCTKAIGSEEFHHHFESIASDGHGAVCIICVRNIQTCWDL